MITLNVKVSGLKEIEAALQGMSRQIPYATSVAINDLAIEVQKAERQQIRRVFTIRNPWMEKGPKAVKIDFAKKQKLQARIYSNADFLYRHETGEAKKPRGSYLAVPVPGIKRTRMGAIATSDKPRAKGTFIINSRKGPIIAQRTSQGRGKSKTSTFRVLFGLEKQARIKPVLHWYEIAQRIVDSQWKAKFSAALERAIRTATR
jgi:hypothetical protein